MTIIVVGVLLLLMFVWSLRPHTFKLRATPFFDGEYAKLEYSRNGIFWHDIEHYLGRSRGPTYTTLLIRPSNLCEYKLLFATYDDVVDYQSREYERYSKELELHEFIQKANEESKQKYYTRFNETPGCD